MIILKLTCGGCPEQYDAYMDSLDGAKVGYLRLRWGQFRVDFPDCGEETIYEAKVGDDGMDGVFQEEDRDYYLRCAVDAIEKRLKFGPQSKDRPPAPDVQYKVVGDTPKMWED